MHSVCANHDLVGMAIVVLKLLGVQIHAHQHGVGLVKINDFHTLFGEGDGGVGENVL